MEDAYSKETNEVLAFFKVDPENGLTPKQVQQGLSLYGRNELAPDKGTPFWRLVLKQFDDLLVKILILAAFVDLGITFFNGETGFDAFVEPGVIVLILIANATVGVITETNAERAIEELKAYEADVATVLRDGRLAILPASELLPGDIVEVTVGCKVPADLRVIELLSNNLRTDQSILTGESGSVEKEVEPTLKARAVCQDKTCILFSGTVVTVGRARAVVVGTGASTAIGKIRDAMAASVEEMTPLKRKLDEFGTFLSKAIAGICVLVWVINIGHFGDPIHGSWAQGCIYYFKVAVALAVAAIPEGLPAVVTTCLALGTRKMAKRNAIVRSLPSVETLGCTTVICSDKTGTLTTNMMSVNKICCAHNSDRLVDFSVTGNSYAPEGVIKDSKNALVEHPPDNPCLLPLALCAALCNDAMISYQAEQGQYQRIGEATEVAAEGPCREDRPPGVLGDAGRAWEALPPGEELVLQRPLDARAPPPGRAGVYTRPKDDERPLLRQQGELHDVPEGGARGRAAEVHLSALQRDGAVIPLGEKTRQLLANRVHNFGARDALRVIALAFKPMPRGSSHLKLEDEEGLTLLGITGMQDPPRLEVKNAIETCRAAGIRVIMVTGDNQATAESVARQIGALDPYEEELRQGKSLVGSEFDELAEDQRENVVQTVSVFARVEPHHKTALVERLKRSGQVVAMTGDGVNDAPALKRADIGVAMGSGTAVAKHASDMVLADDNFATIVSAVSEGRAIYNNTKQFIRYMVSSNIGEVVAVFLAALVGMPETLNPVQLLWVNLVTDGLPAVALGFNKPDRDIMRTRPRRVNESIVNGWLFFRYLVVGLYVGVSTVAGFSWWFMRAEGGPKLTWKELTSFEACVEGEHSYSCRIFSDIRRPSTVSMSVLVTVEMFNALNALSENSSLLVLPPWSNVWLLAAITASMTIHMFILYFPPAAHIFTVAPLTRDEWSAVVWLSFPVIIVDEVLKHFSRHLASRSRVGLRSLGIPSSMFQAPKGAQEMK
eukprot:CAMPEP_0177588372 /NCGR_PEP_ID=MMETSP0419_2-20121207/6190_1 /TAXON_ID=582737 /ORGANISM="Tetraselmis sp., Strain GSL018" /LENGTH=1007 /DNA_ID=CAMNT_0019078565 /DNA_START=254 /DNA_END=3277 /DNA_ORIENTATION=+